MFKRIRIFAIAIEFVELNPCGIALKTYLCKSVLSFRFIRFSFTIILIFACQYFLLFVFEFYFVIFLVFNAYYSKTGGKYIEKKNQLFSSESNRDVVQPVIFAGRCAPLIFLFIMHRIFFFAGTK